MGWTFRRSKQILPGVRINLSSKGIGFSYGSKFGRVTHGADGKKTFYSSIPGTGLRYRKTISSKPQPAWSAEDYQAKIERNEKIMKGKPFKTLYILLIIFWALTTFGTLAALIMPTKKGDSPKSDLVPILMVEILVFLLIRYFFNRMRKNR
jgi:hypothetical protein